MRQLIFAAVLPLVHGFVDRCIYFDAFDTIFQSDPFNSVTNRSRLYVSSEHHNVESNKWMKIWLNDIPGLDWHIFSQNNVYCSGAYGAYADVIQQFSQLHVSMYNYLTFYGEDQGIFNYILYINVLQRGGIDIEANRDFATIGLQITEWSGDKPGEIMSPPDPYKPAIVHQINRNHLMYTKIGESCGLNV